jgi:hypothetical protein
MCVFVGIHSAWCSLIFPDCGFMFIINLVIFSDITISNIFSNISLFLPFYIPVTCMLQLLWFLHSPSILWSASLKIAFCLWFLVWKVSNDLSLISLILWVHLTYGWAHIRSCSFFLFCIDFWHFVLIITVFIFFITSIYSWILIFPCTRALIILVLVLWNSMLNHCIVTVIAGADAYILPLRLLYSFQ